MKRESPPSFHPFPGWGRRKKAVGLIHGTLGAAAQEACKRVEGGGWPLPFSKGRGWKWRVAKPHTAACDDLLSSSMANTVPVLTQPERDESGSACREQPAKGQRLR